MSKINKSTIILLIIILAISIFGNIHFFSKFGNLLLGGIISIDENVGTAHVKIESDGFSINSMKQGLSINIVSSNNNSIKFKTEIYNGYKLLDNSNIDIKAKDNSILITITAINDFVECYEIPVSEVIEYENF